VDTLINFFPIFPALYAEIHYTLKGLSLVYRNWPEILTDAPFRVEPGKKIPILILVKDAHRFPIILYPIHAEINYPDNTSNSILLTKETFQIETPWWFRVIKIKPRDNFCGTLQIKIRIETRSKRRKKIHTFFTDNYRGSSHSPLRVHVAREPFPKFKNWFHGDIHHHSNLTNDQTEFGSPIEATAKIAKAMGISFVGVTDHSYDLDDMEDNYLQNDPNLSKWKFLHEKVNKIEKKGNLVFIPGEEVSCGNAKGKNLHMLLLNNKHFFHGSGDSAERWFKTSPEHTLKEILDNLEENALAFAAHPEVPFPLLQWIFLRRGKWTDSDYRHKKLTGLQILNGSDDLFFRRGFRKWKELLLDGEKLSIVAGNDAHGSFNRYRQLGLPFLYLEERSVHLFGKVRTAVFVNGKLNREKIIKALRSGHSYITTGPAMIIEIKNEKGERRIPGDEIEGNKFTLTINGLSTEEFGRFMSCKIWLGDLTEKREKVIKKIEEFDNNYKFVLNCDLGEIKNISYLRGELITKNNDGTFFCITNPIYINGGNQS